MCAECIYSIVAMHAELYNELYYCVIITLQQGVAIVPQGVGGAGQETGRIT